MLEVRLELVLELAVTARLVTGLALVQQVHYRRMLIERLFLFLFLILNL